MVKSSYNNKEDAAKVIPNAAIVKMVVVEAELAAWADWELLGTADEELLPELAVVLLVWLTEGVADADTERETAEAELEALAVAETRAVDGKVALVVELPATATPPDYINHS